LFKEINTYYGRFYLSEDNEDVNLNRRELFFTDNTFTISAGSVDMNNNNNKILVRTSKGIMVPFNRTKIIRSLINETGIDEDVANEVAFKVEVEIRHMDLEFLSAPLIREIVNVKLLERRLEEARKLYTRIGLPVADVERMIFGNHKYSKENANLQQNPETVHKLIADNVIREYSLLRIIPTKLGTCI